MGKPGTIPAYKSSGDTHYDSKSGMFVLNDDAISKTIHAGVIRADKAIKRKGLAKLDSHAHVSHPPLLATCKDNQKIQKKAAFIAGVCDAPHKIAMKGNTTATTGTQKPAKVKPSPAFTAFFTRDGGFELAPFMKSKAEVTKKITEGQLSPASPIAYRDRNGQIHTGTVMEINKLLPEK